ncbi:hypothetical protein HMPREF1406_01475 [Helicobacter pylori GAM239Bi]|nr:hypothetical protein HMPREF1406_01475 [Helicobacter pylori GAM239Bi]
MKSPLQPPYNPPNPQRPLFKNYRLFFSQALLFFVFKKCFSVF